MKYIESMGVKIYDFQKFTFSTLFELYNAGLGVLISKSHRRTERQMQLVASCAVCYRELN